jgi:hypothetical protein
MSTRPDVYARLDRIKELWRELERTRRTSPRYDELVAEIHSESLAYQALLAEQDDLDRRRTQLDTDSGQDEANRRQRERRQTERRKK